MRNNEMDEMRNDELMDGLLRATLTTPPPRLSDGFDTAVMRRTAPRRLTSTGRALLVSYGLVSAATCVWFMRDLPLPWILAALAAGVVASLGTRAYMTSLARAV